MKLDSAQLQKLQQRHADLQLKIQREKQKLAREERRRDTRRKILAGTEALAEAEQDQEWGARLMKRLNETLERDSDRALFGLCSNEE